MIEMNSAKKQFISDVDIDLADRDSILDIIQHTPAAGRVMNAARRHATGIYVTDIPYDAERNIASIDYVTASARGYIKLDLLNVHLYGSITSESQLTEMMVEPDWELLKDRKFVDRIIHINSHYDTMRRMPEPIDSVMRMAMFLAIIRPGKRHLIGETWSEVEKTIWDKTDDGFTFKKSHSLAYSMLVIVDMNLEVNGLKVTDEPVLLIAS